MRLTMRTNLAMRVLMACAVNKDHIVRRAQVARTINASENHIAQVVNMLSAAGFLTTTRGRAGGLALARAPSEISIGEVFRHFEAGLPFAECFAGGGDSCPLRAACRLRAALEVALDAFYGELDGTSLADLVDDNAGLEALLHIPEFGLVTAGCAQKGASQEAQA